MNKNRKKIAIVGLGLMGGSLSIALRKVYKNWDFIGLDYNSKHSNQALCLGLVDELADNLDDITDCDIIFLSIPVDAIISISKQLTNIATKTTIIDLGSTKEKISKSIPHNIRANFVTAHPMTGTEKFGPTSAIDNLYKDKVVVLCDLEKSGDYQENLAKEIFTNIGMNIICMKSKSHDRHASFISHMPHALSFALANSVMAQEGSKKIIALAGGGFRDMSRIAKSNPTMWEDIFRQNRKNLLESIEAFENELRECKNMIEDKNWEDLNKWMNKANKLHDIIE